MSKNSSAKYYQGNKKQLQKRVGEKYQGLSKEEKKNRQYSRERYTNLPEMKNKSRLSIEIIL